MGIGIYISTKRTYRRGEEHGSAKWGVVERINKKYRAKEPKPNKILTQNIRIGLNGKKHRRNLNTVVVGGSGAGKPRFYAKPCIYESITAGKDGEFCSFVCLDPKHTASRRTQISHLPIPVISPTPQNWIILPISAKPAAGFMPISS